MEQSLWDILSQYKMFEVWHVLHKIKYMDDLLCYGWEINS